jgi:ethanolamine-phosphate cytidylyltransferase
VYHGPTSFMPLASDPYGPAKQLGIFKEVPNHDFDHVNAGEIVQRILGSKAMFEERQRVKGVKGIGEAAKRREELEGEAKKREEELIAKKEAAS